eukprot:TRINITY_DN7367_c0_g1_i1.p1 TRINITY_DN7367_c0_g1~~TRINITY_DN7367_c0_g1_i1.p1  ORF type:complete len:206 (+),score=47.80 TRINITY_DN7367_c0_g1_i1:97-714(+)
MLTPKKKDKRSATEMTDNIPTTLNKKVGMSQLLRHQKLMPLQEMEAPPTETSLSLTYPTRRVVQDYVEGSLVSDYDPLLQKRPGTATTTSDLQRMKEGIHSANMKLDDYMRDVAKRMMPSFTQGGCDSSMSATPPLFYSHFDRTAEQAANPQAHRSQSLVGMLFNKKIEPLVDCDEPLDPKRDEDPEEGFIVLTPKPPSVPHPRS